MNILHRIIVFAIVIALPLSCTRKPRGRIANSQNQTSSVSDNHANKGELNNTNDDNNIEKNYDYSVKVTRIIDGDTFEAISLNDKIELSYRIYAIDAPEKKQPYEIQSKQYLYDLINDKVVNLKIQKKRDGFGRPVVWVYTQDEKDISAEMLKAGMAWHFKKYDTSKEYEDLENTAKINRIGLWEEKKPVAPWDYKKK